METLGITQIKDVFIFAIQLLSVTLGHELVFSDSGCTLSILLHWDIWAESRRNGVTTEPPPDAVLRYQIGGALL